MTPEKPYPAGTNFRHLIIQKDLDKIEQGKHRLNTWEKDFYESIKTLNVKKFSVSQFNTVQEIAGRFK